MKLNEPMPSTVISSSLGSIDGSLSSSNTPHDVNSLSSFSHSAYSSVTTTAANAPVAPHPFAPRKEKTTFVRKAAGEVSAYIDTVLSCFICCICVLLRVDMD